MEMRFEIGDRVRTKGSDPKVFIVSGVTEGVGKLLYTGGMEGWISGEDLEYDFEKENLRELESYEYALHKLVTATELVRMGRKNIKLFPPSLRHHLDEELRAQVRILLQALTL